MRCSSFALLIGIALVGCQSSAGDGDGDDDCTDGAGCPCDEETPCEDGLTCMDEGGASECGCADPSGLGCPCDSEADCGVGELGQNVCEGGTCQAPCAPDPNLMEDVANCGECGNACPDPQGSCQAGECYGAAAYGECFVPGGDVSCEDQCQLLGEGTVCSEACSDGAWAGFDIPSCMDAPSQTGTCGDLIANPFASAHCCCVEKLD